MKITESISELKNNDEIWLNHKARRIGFIISLLIFMIVGSFVVSIFNNQWEIFYLITALSFTIFFILGYTISDFTPNGIIKDINVLFKIFDEINLKLKKELDEIQFLEKEISEYSKKSDQISAILKKYHK